MISLFNDRYKISLLLAALFILGIGVSLYFIYSLPQGLQLAQGYAPAFTKVYADTCSLPSQQGHLAC